MGGPNAEGERVNAFWAKRFREIEAIDPENPSVDWTNPELPLARIKKIMKVSRWWWWWLHELPKLVRIASRAHSAYGLSRS
jgi:hypothetical protein